MNITLMHNPNAGVEAHDGEQLAALLKKAGHKVTYQSVKEKNYQDILEKPTDLVLAAGGDGTIKRVAMAVHATGRDMMISALPLGTANNLAHTLGLTAPVDDIISMLTEAKLQTFDMGQMVTPWGEFRFIEGCGTGLFPKFMRSAERRQSENRPVKKIPLLLKKIANLESLHWEARLDGKDISGEYLFFEAMNIRSVGPALLFAPQAKMNDGYLDFVGVTEADRAGIVKAVEQTQEETHFTLPFRRFRHLHLQWNEELFHVDDKLHPKKGETVPSTGSIEINVLQAALRFLIPVCS